MKKNHFDTLALHEGHDPKNTQTSRAIPIHFTSSYVFENIDHAANAFNLSTPAYIYTRLNNPTNDILEQRLAALEGGIGAVVTSSGASAITTTLLTLLKAGDHILASNSLYGGTYNLLQVTLRRFNIQTSFVDFDDITEVEAAIKENTKVLFLESLGNPKLDVIDFDAIAHLAQKYELPVIVDNTVPSPYLFQPIQHGADIVIHSLTKYISGNGTSLGGAIIDAGTYNWAAGKFPEFTSPNPGYHGLILSDIAGEAAFITKIRIEGLRDLGAALSPFNAFQILQGLETLSIRLKSISEKTLALAQWLQSQDAVEWVNYPGLPTHPQYELAKKYFAKGASGVLTFGLKGGYEAAKKLVDAVEIFSLLANIGDTKSLIIHPASTTHQQLNEEEQKATGVTPDLIRLSIGLEDIEDLKADLSRTF